MSLFSRICCCNLKKFWLQFSHTKNMILSQANMWGKIFPTVTFFISVVELALRRAVIFFNIACKFQEIFFFVKVGKI